MTDCGRQEPLRVLLLAEQLDVSYVRRLRTALAEAFSKSDAVHLDLSAARAIDSSCIRELLRFQAVAARADKAFVVVSTNANIRRLFVAADAADLLAETVPAEQEVAS